MNCPNCGAGITDGADVCFTCGSTVKVGSSNTTNTNRVGAAGRQPQKCCYCGSILPDNSTVCFQCGTTQRVATDPLPHSVDSDGKRICINCGNRLSEGATVCFNCGTAQNIKRPNPVRVMTREDEEKDEAAGNILKFGILGLVFSITMWLSALGIIFSLICKFKVGRFKSKYKETAGRATVGKVFSTVGLIVGSLMCVILIVVIFTSGFEGMLQMLQYY